MDDSLFLIEVTPFKIKCRDISIIVGLHTLPPSVHLFCWSQQGVVINICDNVDHQAPGGAWTSDVIAQNTGLYQVLVKLRFNDAQTADGQGYLYTKTSSNEYNIRPSLSKTFSHF